MTCAKLWPDLSIIFQINTTLIFMKFGLWACKTFVKWVLLPVVGISFIIRITRGVRAVFTLRWKYWLALCCYFIADKHETEWKSAPPRDTFEMIGQLSTVIVNYLNIHLCSYHLPHNNILFKMIGQDLMATCCWLVVVETQALSLIYVQETFLWPLSILDIPVLLDITAAQLRQCLSNMNMVCNR